MSALETKIRCPKCHGRFFVPLAEIGRDNTTPCPNCGTPVRVKAKADDAAKLQKVQQAVEELKRELPADVPVTIEVDVVETPAARPWWKFWAR